MGHCTQDQYQVLNRSVRGVPVPIRVSRNTAEPPTTEQLRVILRTLELVPPQHLSKLSPPGHVQVSRPGCAPRRGGGNGGLSRWIRLSAAAIGADYNRTLNVTLLHELGHVIDSVYGGMRWLQDNDRDGYRLLAATPGTPAPPSSPGERFADCYMIFLITQVAGRSYTHRADPSRLSWRAGDAALPDPAQHPGLRGLDGAVVGPAGRRAAGAEHHAGRSGPAADAAGLGTRPCGRLEGSCHCGAVRFSVESHAPVPYMHCYCSICRKTAGGGGYAINLMGEAETLTVEGMEHVTAYAIHRSTDPAEISGGPRRHFCKHCGSALWGSDPRWAQWVYPHASAIDTPLPDHIMPARRRIGWPRTGPNHFDEYPGPLGRRLAQGPRVLGRLKGHTGPD